MYIDEANELFRYGGFPTKISNQNYWFRDPPAGVRNNVDHCPVGSPANALQFGRFDYIMIGETHQEVAGNIPDTGRWPIRQWPICGVIHGV